ncbi:MAG: hypothetical protein WBN96_01490 [Gammaproteobacteria bacterium]
MPASNNIDHADTADHKVAGQGLAVTAEALYVLNLLLLPFLSFAILVYLFLTKHHKAPPLARSHLEQTMSASIWIAVMFIAAAGCIMLLQLWGLEDVTAWILVVITFTIVHASMVLLGVMGLAKAMAGKCWRYPLFGKALLPGCNQ